MLFEPHRPHGMSDADYISHIREMILTLDRLRDYCLHKQTNINVPGGDKSFDGTQDSMFRAMYKLGYGDFAWDLATVLGQFCRKLEYELLRVNGPILSTEEDGA